MRRNRVSGLPAFLGALLLHPTVSAWELAQQNFPAVMPAPTIHLLPYAAVANRRHLEKPAQSMIIYYHSIPRPQPIPRPTWIYPHPITNPPWPPMPFYTSFQYHHCSPMPPNTYNSPREQIYPYYQLDTSVSHNIRVRITKRIYIRNIYNKSRTLVAFLNINRLCVSENPFAMKCTDEFVNTAWFIFHNSIV